MSSRVPSLVVVAVLASSVVAMSHADIDVAALRVASDTGVRLAHAGNLAAAESVFMAILSNEPGDPRTLTNLGNVHLLKGERELALACYDQAAWADSADPGIRFDSAVVLWLMGQDSLARAAAPSPARTGEPVTWMPSALDPVENGPLRGADAAARYQFPVRSSPVLTMGASYRLGGLGGRPKGASYRLGGLVGRPLVLADAAARYQFFVRLALRREYVRRNPTAKQRTVIDARQVRALLHSAGTGTATPVTAGPVASSGADEPAAGNGAAMLHWKR